jgi:D-arabinose 5-phosphate isomerase GutQ
MQLNMGLGKSSVVVPIVAATLADTTKLAKVVILKELSEQML